MATWVGADAPFGAPLPLWLPGASLFLRVVVGRARTRRVARTLLLFRPREAGEGDHARHGGGGHLLSRRALRKDDAPQLDLGKRSGRRWRSKGPRPGILLADRGASFNSSPPRFAVDCCGRGLRPRGKKNNDAAD